MMTKVDEVHAELHEHLGADAVAFVNDAEE